MFRPESLVQQKEQPLLDYIESIKATPQFSDYNQISRKKRLKYLVLRTVELGGMLWDIAEDIVGKSDFVPAIGTRGNGRNRVLNARRWAKRTEFNNVLLSVAFDILAGGEGYIHIGAKSNEIKKQVDRIANEEVATAILDEAVFNPLFRPISTTTMTNNHNDTNLVGYQQLHNGSEINFSVEEIIHLFFKRLAGRVEGFSLISLVPLQVELLWLLWINQHDLQAKGNMPDMFVVAEDIRSNTPAIKELENKMRKYNAPGNAKHGSTVLYGGKYSFEKMEKDTSLQFEDVGKTITGIFASLFRYPKHRTNVKTKESASDKDTGGNGDRDYWDIISKYQDKLSFALDSQLFEPYFGVNLVFDKSYKHDSVVENTAMRARIDNINLVNGMLMKHKKQIPEEDVIRFIQGKNIQFDTEKLDDSVLEMQMATQMPMAGTPAKNKDESLSQEKKVEQVNSERNTGKVGAK
jgi:hypothetical protein